MRVLVSVVGKRTEHWEGLFSALMDRSDLELDVWVADVTDITVEWLSQLADSHRGRFSFDVLPHRIGEGRTGHMASIMHAPLALRARLPRRPDLIHIIGEPSYLATAQIIGLRNRRWPGVPITHYAAQNVAIRFPWPFPMLERRAYRQITAALPITAAARDVLRSKGYCGPAPIVPLGVDRSRFVPAASAPVEPFTVGFVGRLEPHKGIADLLEAARSAACRLLVVGDGSLRDAVAAEARARPGDVELVPWSDHDQLPGLLQRMHVLALPSIGVVQRNVLPWMGIPLREQFGRVLVEAMSCGVPCIASDVGEVADVIADAGLLVRPQQPHQLAAAFAHLRDAPSRHAAFRAASLARAPRFGWDHIAADVCGLWRRLAHASEPSCTQGSSTTEQGSSS
jgi:glycosyltransferase involved in cell wall biosynthesis